MHDPIGRRATRWFSPVENEHPLHPYQLAAGRRRHRLRLSGGLPVTGDCRSVAAVIGGSLDQIEKVSLSFALA